MPEGASHQVVLSSVARRDIASIIRHSLSEFGESASLRYEALILQALTDLSVDPRRPGSKERSEIVISGARTYHLVFSRHRVKGRRVKEPTHFLLYRCLPGFIVEVARILHDSRDLKRHLPEDFKS